MDTDTPCPAMRSALAILNAEHRGFATVLRALLRHLRPVLDGREPPNHDLFATILGYADTFMDRFHHPKEDEHLFRAVRGRTTEADETLRRLQHEHAAGPAEVRELQRSLARCRGGGAADAAGFASHLERYIVGQEAHMNVESVGIVPIARRVLKPVDWEAVDAAFKGHADPFFGTGPTGRADTLFRLRFGFAPQDPGE